MINYISQTWLSLVIVKYENWEEKTATDTIKRSMRLCQCIYVDCKEHIFDVTIPRKVCNKSTAPTKQISLFLRQCTEKYTHTYKHTYKEREMKVTSYVFWLSARRTDEFAILLYGSFLGCKEWKGDVQGMKAHLFIHRDSTTESQGRCSELNEES